MVLTSQLKSVNKQRDNLFKILGILVLPAPFLAIGFGMLIGGFKNATLWVSLVGFVFIVLGIFVGVRLFKGLHAYKKMAYALFMNNDVFVDPNDVKLRSVERIALEKFDGDLKLALSYVAEHPELRRRERFALMAEWCDYERDYIQNYYGKHPMRVAQVNRTDPLTIARIEADLAGISRKYRKEAPVFTVKTAWCTQKDHSVGIDGDSDSYYLCFGLNGRCEVDAGDHNMAYVGEEYCIVTIEGATSPVLAYSKEEWTPNEAVEYLLSD